MDSHSYALVAATVAVVSVIATMLGLYLSHRSEMAAGRARDEINEYTILRGLASALQERNETLAQALDRTRAALGDCMENVTTLTDHITAHAPELELPPLRDLDER